MLSHIIVVGVQHDEQPGAVGVVIVAAGLGRPVLRGVGVIEVIHIVEVQRIVVADGRGHGQALERLGIQITAYSSSLGLPLLLTWSPAEMMKLMPGFCSVAISSVRFQPKLSFRAAVLATPASAARLSVPGAVPWRRRSGGLPHRASLCWRNCRSYTPPVRSPHYSFPRCNNMCCSLPIR